MTKRTLNRIKIVLIEQGKTNKWLADKLGKNNSTVSRWCTNEMQPSLETIFNIAAVLQVDARELIASPINKIVSK